MDSRVWFSGLLALVACERGLELVLSSRHAAAVLARGGEEHGQGHYPWMVAVHGLFFVACPLEVWLLGRPFVAGLGVPMLALAGLAMALRYWAVTSLGDRWNTRVIVVAGMPPVTTGPYRLLRHPNYLAVVVEIAALPLIHTAWLTALTFSAANAVVLRTRIRIEERALETAAGAAR